MQAPKTSGRVFISYASQDTSVAQRLCTTLEAAGLPCWIAPRDVRAGESYAAAIVQAINSCRMLVLILSKSAIESSHVLREVERASSKKRPVLSIRMDATPLPPDLEYFLSANQWLDASGGPIEQILPALVESVRDHDSAPGASTTAARSGSAPVPSPGPQTSAFLWRTRAIAIALAVATVGLAYVVTNKLWLPKHIASEQPSVAATNAVNQKSIAVLPFTDMSEKKDQEYFADGMAEEILDVLAKIPGLMVIGRTSSFQFKGKNADLRTIGTELNAAYVLEGSVRKFGDQVRITAQLINARTGAHEWSETYDRHIGDVLRLQDAIGSAVARELQLTVAPDDVNSRSTPKNAEVYDLYLRGRHAYDRHENGGLDEAATLFQRALDLDPTFVDAAVWLAWTRVLQGQFGYLAPTAAFEQGRARSSERTQIGPTKRGGACRTRAHPYRIRLGLGRCRTGTPTGNNVSPRQRQRAIRRGNAFSDTRSLGRCV